MVEQRDLHTAAAATYAWQGHTSSATADARDARPYRVLQLPPPLQHSQSSPQLHGAPFFTFREMGSQKWGWFAVGFQMLVGYVLAMSVYQLGVLFAGGGFGVWTAVAILVDLWCIWMILRPGRK